MASGGAYGLEQRSARLLGTPRSAPPADDRAGALIGARSRNQTPSGTDGPARTPSAATGGSCRGPMPARHQARSASSVRTSARSRSRRECVVCARCGDLVTAATSAHERRDALAPADGRTNEATARRPERSTGSDTHDPQWRARPAVPHLPSCRGPPPRAASGRRAPAPDRGPRSLGRPRLQRLAPRAMSSVRSARITGPKWTRRVPPGRRKRGKGNGGRPWRSRRSRSVEQKQPRRSFDLAAAPRGSRPGNAVVRGFRLRPSRGRRASPEPRAVHDVGRGRAYSLIAQSQTVRRKRAVWASRRAPAAFGPRAHARARERPRTSTPARVA